MNSSLSVSMTMPSSNSIRPWPAVSTISTRWSGLTFEKRIRAFLNPISKIPPNSSRIHMSLVFVIGTVADLSGKD
jgi:hypothetical protein